MNITTYPGKAATLAILASAVLALSACGDKPKDNPGTGDSSSTSAPGAMTPPPAPTTPAPSDMGSSPSSAPDAGSTPASSPTSLIQHGPARKFDGTSFA